jgi:hypothetical protein
MVEKNNVSDKGIGQNIMFVILTIALIAPIILFNVANVAAVPVGPTILFNSTQTVSPRVATQITTAGGSFTTLVINATTQTPRWKAYVGNVTGKLALDDANNKSIFDWSVTSVTGEVYATRNSTIDWSTIMCANSTVIINEQSGLNISNSNPDSINRTFANRVHRSFYVGTSLITNSTCPAIATYVNGSSQASLENASFQEILLTDSASRMVYSTLINQNTTGYNAQKFDFQMIVAENEFQQTPTTYYLYAELI